MKQIKEVEKTRRAYHRDPSLNSVHRSSLMVPEIVGTEVDISFLNHFLLKRGHKNVACIITAIDNKGKKIESRLQKIDRPIVYNFTLTGMVKEPISNYMIEFFSADNLFIPFPAVMINHRGKNFINQVHSFNRILNDIFEDDSINAHQVREASVDLPIQKDTDTFFLFTAGPLPCKSTFEVEIDTSEKKYKKTVYIDLPRFGTQKISVRENFEIPEGVGGIIKAQQPKQFLFYGRMLCGQINKDGAFSANHSFYDSSTTEEYWDNNSPSKRCYPFFAEFTNIVRLYPIMSPSDLNISIVLNSDNGSSLGEFECGNIISPSNHYLDINVNSILSEQNITQSVSSFIVVAKTRLGKMPTRIGHQLVYGAGGLNSSIAVSLFNPNIFIPENKQSFKWGQIILGDAYDSFVGIVADSAENPKIEGHEFNVKFYDKTGLIAERNWSLNNGASKKFKASEELKSHLKISDDKRPAYIWYTIEGNHYGLNFFSTAFNKLSKHSSGDHGF